MKLKKINILFFLIFFSAINYACAEEPSQKRQNEIKYLLLNDCGSCHGMTLKGGIGPALTPEALSNKSEEDLFQTINNGRSGTPMPPWEKFLSKHEITWLVGILKKGIDQ